MLILRKATSNKTKKTYTCIGTQKGDNFIALTFDSTTILKLVNLTWEELFSLPIGEYKITEKGDLE